MSVKRSRSTLHLLMGQKTLYLLLTAAFFALMVMAYRLAGQRQTEEPPIITLSEAQGFAFEPGSPAINAAFRDRLRMQVVPRLEAAGESHALTVVEVVGHTDGSRLSARLRQGSDLDEILGPWLAQTTAVTPAPYDNVGLGIVRAVSVSRALREAGLGDGFTVVPLSAGPFLAPDDAVSPATLGSDAKRRRIEIRLRRRH